MKQPRDYQSEAHKTILRELHQNGKKDQLLVMATGLGKTYAASTLTNEFNRCLWLTHKEELIDQSALSLLGEIHNYNHHKAIESLGGYLSFLDGIKTGRYWGLMKSDEAHEIRKAVGVVKEQRMDKNSKVVVASVQTMINRLKYFNPEDFDLVIVDEAHLAMAKGFQKILSYFSPELLLGLTATPTRLDGANLCTTFGEITYNRDIKFGIDNGWLVEIDAICVKTELSLDTVGRRGGEFKSEDLERIVNTPTRNRFVVTKWQEYAEGKQTLVFAVDVKHCIALHNEFIKRGIKSTFIVGDKTLCPNRRERIAMFKSFEVQVMINVDIATTGFDHDMVECLIMSRPTMSLTLFIQMMGRGTRTEKGVIDGLTTPQERIAAIKNSKKKELLVLDITDNTSRHNLINTWNLDKEKEPDDRIFTTKEKIEMIKAERKRKLKHHLKTDHRVDLLKLPKLQIYKSGKNLEKATDKQLATLEREGYDIVNVYYTKYDATMIISNFPAAKWQLKKLEAMKYDVSKGCNIGQFSEIMQKAGVIQKSTVPVGSQLLKLPFAGLE